MEKLCTNKVRKYRTVTYTERCAMCYEYDCMGGWGIVMRIMFEYPL